MEGKIAKAGTLVGLLIMVALVALILLVYSISWCITSNFDSNVLGFALVVNPPFITGTILLARTCYRAHKENKLYLK